MNQLSLLKSGSFTPANIHAFESQMVKAKCVEMEGRERFVHGTGTACKIVKFKKGELILGKYHREATINHLISGEILIATEEGGAVYRAPSVFVSPPGVRKLGYAITDVEFTNTHATEQISPESIEQELICVRAEDLELPKPCLPPQGLCDDDRETLKILIKRFIVYNDNDKEVLDLMGKALNEHSD